MFGSLVLYRFYPLHQDENHVSSVAAGVARNKLIQELLPISCRKEFGLTREGTQLGTVRSTYQALDLLE